ncbi:unnamed protein product [Spirodela intermedia]|uniref:Uncharacterized protein n=1 Tax=Spirodela intermedia TaxID=51605 RepID=A0A7I8KTN2_SPIIN|nr:unnamed protein product [Spirodela intermedia]
MVGQPARAMVSSNSSLRISTTLLTPCSPFAARPKTTGLPTWTHDKREKGLTITALAPRAKALKTSVPRRMPPSKRTGTDPATASTTCQDLTMFACAPHNL